MIDEEFFISNERIKGGHSLNSRILLAFLAHNMGVSYPKFVMYVLPPIVKSWSEGTKIK